MEKRRKSVPYPLFILRSLLVILGLSVSGQNVFAMAREAGADSSEAVNKCDASTLKDWHTEGEFSGVIFTP